MEVHCNGKDLSSLIAYKVRSHLYDLQLYVGCILRPKTKTFKLLNVFSIDCLQINFFLFSNEAFKNQAILRL